MASTTHTSQDPNGLDTAAIVRRLSSSGPDGFVASVWQTLRTLQRPYVFANHVPGWLYDAEPGAFDAVYAESGMVGQEYAPFRTTPHVIVHRTEERPTRLGSRETSYSDDAPAQQKRPAQEFFHCRPLPESVPPAGYAEMALTQTRFRGIGDPPMWDDISQVPDFLQEHALKEGTVFRVQQWVHAVTVDFTCFAATESFVRLMMRDLKYVLYTFHHRANSGDSNLHGWHVWTQDGPGELDVQDMKGVPSRTIRWALQQSEAIAVPTDLLESVEITANVVG